ncbi:MAG TPA: hypothetical protein VIV11_23675 [Kofleriaceae bacterium]
MAPEDDDDPKVKQLLDSTTGTATDADLARWFSLPSFQQIAEQPSAEPVVDEEMQAVIERRERALASVDPRFVAALYERNEDRPVTLLKFKPSIDVHVDEQFGMLDEAMIERAASIAEPREIEISDELRDDMNECTPQALLRDLHRAELDFDKQFEIVDFAAEQRFDIVAEVKTAMATSWKLPELGPSPFSASAAVLDGVRAQRRQRWTDVLPEMRNRRVRE